MPGNVRLGVDIPRFPALLLPVPSGQSQNEFYQSSALFGPFSIREPTPATLLDDLTGHLLCARGTSFLLLRYAGPALWRGLVIEHLHHRCLSVIPQPFGGSSFVRNSRRSIPRSVIR